MARTLFFRMILRKFSEITSDKPIFSMCNIFYNYEYFSFQSAFWTLLNHRQRSQSNHEQCSLYCNSLYFLVLLCTHYGLLQCSSTYFCKLKEIRDLRPIFPDCYFLWLCFHSFFSLEVCRTFDLSLKLRNFTTIALFLLLVPSLFCIFPVQCSLSIEMSSSTPNFSFTIYVMTFSISSHDSLVSSWNPSK